MVSVVCIHIAFKLFIYIHLHAHTVCPCVCAWTKEAVNLTMSAGRTSSCPILHLGKRPTSNNTSVLTLVEVLWLCLQQQRPDASTSSWSAENHPKNVVSHHSEIASLQSCDCFILSNSQNLIQFCQELPQFVFDSTALIRLSRSPNGNASEWRLKYHATLSPLPEQLAGGRFSSEERRWIEGDWGT